MHVSCAQVQGGRDYQEDRFIVISKFADIAHFTLCVVCDGHGGNQASTFLVSEFPQKLLLVFADYRACLAEPPARHRANAVFGVGGVDDIRSLFIGIPEDKTKKIPAVPPCSRKEHISRLMGFALQQCIIFWDKACFGVAYGKITNDHEKAAFFATVDSVHWNANGMSAGSTIAAMLIDTKKRRAHIVHLGDSRISWRIDGTGIAQTEDHNVKRHMTPIPGFKCTNVDGRLQGDLSMGSAFGDNDPELYGVVSRDYETQVISFKHAAFRTAIATDGLWDACSNQQVLYEAFDDADAVLNMGLAKIQQKNSDAIQELVEEGLMSKTDAQAKMSTPPAFEDNTTLIYVKIAPPKQEVDMTDQKDALVDQARIDKLEKAEELFEQFSTLMNDIKLSDDHVIMSTEPPQKDNTPQKQQQGRRRRKSSVSRRLPEHLRPLGSSSSSIPIFREVTQGNTMIRLIRKTSKKK